MRHFIMLITAFGLLVNGCGDSQQSAQSPQQPSPEPLSSPKRLPTSTPQTVSIPGDVSFSSIESHVIPGVKRSLDVRLNKAVSEDTLRAIALKLESEDARSYDRTFITYYLPGMEVGSGAWATSHFDPDLEVRILGFTPEEEKRLAVEPTPENREIIGRWRCQFPPSRITISREGGKIYLEQKLKDGGSLKINLEEKQSPLGRRFDKVEGSSSGDHWIVDSQANLQIRDNQGLFTTAKKID